MDGRKNMLQKVSENSDQMIQNGKLKLEEYS